MCINPQYQFTLQTEFKAKHKQYTFAGEVFNGRHVYTHRGSLKNEVLLPMQNRRVPPNLLPLAAQGGEDNFLLQRWKRGFLENAMTFCQASVSQVKQKCRHASRAQVHNKGSMWGTKSFFVSGLKLVVHFIYFKYITTAYYMQWIQFCYSVLWETTLVFFFSAPNSISESLYKIWERKDQHLISEVLLRAQASKLLLN